MKQQIIFTNHVAETIDETVARLDPTSVFTIVDTNTATFVLPRLVAESKSIADSRVIKTPAGDRNKCLESVSEIWRQLCDGKCTRNSLIINVGGGVITDMGAFAAATFKRGVRFINVPTSLLGAVDAAIGGKTGVNFNGLKNEIGVFKEAETVIISTTFFNTLNDTELLSGYAEMLKHALISSEDDYNKLIAYDVTSYNWDRLLYLLEDNVSVKSRIVEQDPTESGIRKALNFGHTAGHALEEFALENQSPIPHGYAVAYGIVIELILSNMKGGFPSVELHRFARYVKENYGVHVISCKSYDRLIELMRHDKKNLSPDKINFTLLTGIGNVEIDSTATVDEIKAALDIFCDLMGA
ncbi:MAG: 3-dehydroquinate synthase [Muribaculaceae bacterium]|nr:3-dehydroquinate synthase [Muribaculaceae bacterium]